MENIKYQWTSIEQYDEKCPPQEKMIIKQIFRIKPYNKISPSVAFRQSVRRRGHVFTDEAWQGMMKKLWE